MSPETEHSEEPSTLPPPELNPLLNPLLADNMGRWAQVYFTNPPERRDAAVHDLLRQLEAEHSTRTPAGTTASSPSACPQTASSAAVPSSVTGPSPSTLSSPSSKELQVHTTLVRCLACGRKNPSTQRFCGLCGTRLGEEGSVATLHRDDLPNGALPPEDVQTASPQGYARSDPYESTAYESPANTNKLSLFQSSGGHVSYHNEDSDEIFSAPGSSGSFRIYVIFVVAIFLGAIAYLVWRSGQSQAKRPEPSTSSNSTDQPSDSAPSPTSPSKANGAKVDIPDRTPPTENLATGHERGAKPNRKKEEALSRPERAAATSPTIARPPTNPPTSALTGGGAAELAVAQGYLSGANGQGRNSAEAAKWLWKAIAKHNANATFLLSDLYLKGDGVSKNCDQARVLLDTAALKGVKGAGERLRHLQAFGCQ